MKHTAYAILTLTLLAACSPKHRVTYISDAPRNQAVDIEQTYTSQINVGDQLYINVYSQMAQAALPFNQHTTDPMHGKLPRGYTVSQSGYINFPILGRLHVAGLTHSQLEQLIADSLVHGQYLTDPIVSVSLTNFNVTVIGEVATPQTITPQGSRITILEALAICGDATPYGIRTNAHIIRQWNDSVIVDTVDLTSRNLFSSPYYYLRNGDIIFIEPTEKRKRTAYTNDDWQRMMTTGQSTLRLAYTMLVRYLQIVRIQNQ